MVATNEIITSTASLETKENMLIEALKAAQSLIVAYSGGVDSSLLAYYARRVLGDKAKIVIAISPSLAGDELAAARAQAAQFDWDLIEIETDEVSRQDYQRNDAMRCYFCKSTLFETLDKMCRRLDVRNMAYGANVDDLKDFRPGHKAAREFNVLSPLQTAHLTKGEIRELASRAGLPSWDRPQAACLSSRFPTFEPVTVVALSRVDQAEQYLHSLGFMQVRVRTHTLSAEVSPSSNSITQLLARIEIDRVDLPRFADQNGLFERVSAYFKQLGYDLVTLDLEGYRQGSTNVASLRSHGGELAAEQVLDGQA